jgi:hypothetical protein
LFVTLAFTPGRIWRNFLIPPSKENIVADALSCLDINVLLIPQEEAPTLMSESENNNIKLPMHTVLTFKDQMKVPGLRDKGCYFNLITLCSTLRDMAFCVVKIRTTSLNP